MMDLNYKQGLERLKELLSLHAPRALQQFYPLEARLLENRRDQDLYGPSDNNKHEYAVVIKALSTLIDEQLSFSVSFIDLCASVGVENLELAEQDVRLAPVSSSTLTPWTVGDMLSVEGQEYALDEIVEQQWSGRTGALYQKAAGRQVRTGQRVWLQRCQISRSHEAAQILKGNLEHEARLLLALQRDGQRDFPRLLGSEQSAQNVTLVVERLAGRSLLSAFEHFPRPLDPQAVHRLLQGRYTLVRMLHVLHQRRRSHRMLTPATLLLQPGSNKIVLMDTGLAAHAVRRGEGPESYRSPEQVRGMPIPAHSTDIYQLGALFYHLITGQLITDPSPAPGHALSPELDAVLRKATAPQIRDRWSTVYDFSHALRQLGY